MHLSVSSTARGTTRRQVAALENRVLEVLDEHSPASVRQVFYRCLERNGGVHVAKDVSGYKRVQRVILRLRRDGRIPWSAIVDGTRAARSWDVAYDDLTEFVEAVSRHFQLEFWAGHIGKHVEIWSESRGFAASIEPAAMRWRCTSVAFGGQPSDTLLYECAERILARDCPTWVIYCGDLDPHGKIIEDTPRRKLGDQWNCRPEWTRLLVTPDQIESYNLPTDESGQIVQAEAFPPRAVHELLDTAFSTIANQQDIEALKREEAAATARLHDAAVELDGHD